MKKMIYSIGCIALIFLYSCGGAQDAAENYIVDTYKKVSKSDMPLTNELVEKYIRAYRELRKQGPEFLQYVNESPESVVKGKEGFARIEGILQEAGFKDYPEFVVVNARIAWAFNITEGILAVADFEAMKNSGLHTIDSVLADPQVPEETKIELRKGREKIVAQWNNDKKWADFTLEKIGKLTSEADKEVIRRYRKELLEVYSGVKLIPAE